MKPSLQLKMGQQLTMTPQLQQAIRLLQLSTLDLQQEIQEVLESNPMLESEEAILDQERRDQEASNANEGEQLVDLNAQEPPSPSESQEPEWSESIPNDLPVDSGWEEVYSSMPASSDDEFDPLTRSRTTESLQEYLQWQLNLTPTTDTDRLLGETLIEAINPDGYLTNSLEDIFQSLTLNPALAELDFDELKVMQRRIQQFDPVGCGSENLKECLSVQLAQLPSQTPFIHEAQKLIDHYLEALGSRDYSQIMRRTRMKEHQLKEALSLIQSLNPKPGSEVDQSEPEYITPDISVRKVKERWVVELNSESLPRLRINNSYASLVQRANSSRDNQFMKNQLQEARWFLKNLQSRNDTLLKVATKIVNFQQDFLEQGDEAMKPLVLADIAEAVEMHESTISRVTTQKYMHTPRGVYELKYFFSSHVSTDSGGECSSTAIRALIKKLVQDENPGKPLSDNKIAGLLGEQGIKVARRTIAKYRESMHIPPSNERKCLV
ncbi:RNA polymerase factor sigma-54 [Endozoicomonas montiporae]|uniref:RNA polymerase sigma-54 factor n=2 Tax=Endozoicomonas montiporae TaxID=1027273 RepID=A0A081N2V6_9GAMM|nr:RNA polymerase factor sigma-54 [Endozoicomonas montiporae]AMO58048.1 RNA polymerase factor sigma-54 [Endozoicomonas montiporae CL-33]KEQ12779.1 RNA polymerase factor sigma-54 [Endozoicomonas montiporae]